jgi:superfamily I DNA/RNA helicase
MKALCIISLLLAIVMHSFAQDDAIKKYFNKYADDTRFTSVYVSNKMFSMFSNLSDKDDDKELRDILNKLGGLRILTSDQANGAKLYQEAHGLLVTNGFEDLMEVKEKGKSEFKFLIREVNGKIRELLMLSGSGNKFFLMSLIGDIDLKKISKLSKSLDVEGMENLDKLKNN